MEVRFDNPARIRPDTRRTGGWVLGDLDTEHPVSLRLCQTLGCVIFNVDYRL